MDPEVRKQKFSELTTLYNEVIKAHVSGNKVMRDEKWEERKIKVAEFKALKNQK
jgi:hypothetical protein